MSFTLGGFDTRAVRGLRAVLQAWPMAPVDPILIDLPGGGSALSGSRMASTSWVFNLVLSGRSVLEVMATADQISAALQTGSLQPFTRVEAPGYVWQGICDGGVEWERHKILWIGSCYRMTGKVTIVTPHAYGYANPDDTVAGAWSNWGALTLQRLQGNAPSYPTIRIHATGTLSSQSTIAIGPVSVQGPVQPGEDILLDYLNLEFGIYRSGAKTANIAHRLGNLERPILAPGSRTEWKLSGAFSGTLTISANSRRI